MCCCCIDCLFSGLFKFFGLLASCLSCGLTGGYNAYAHFDSDADVEGGAEQTRQSMAGKCQDCTAWSLTIMGLLLILAIFGMQIATLVIVTDTVPVEDIEKYVHIHTRSDSSLAPRDVGGGGLFEPRSHKRLTVAFVENDGGDPGQFRVALQRHCLMSVHEYLSQPDVDFHYEQINLMEVPRMCTTFAEVHMRVDYVDACSPTEAAVEKFDPNLYIDEQSSEDQ